MDLVFSEVLKKERRREGKEKPKEKEISLRIEGNPEATQGL